MRKWIYMAGVFLVCCLLCGLLLWQGNAFFDTVFLRASLETYWENPEGGRSVENAWQGDQESLRSWLQAQEYQVMQVTGEDGTRLIGTYIRAHVPAGRTAILVHGYAGNRSQLLHMAHVFVEQLGYNVLMPDLRAHGDSGGEQVGFGWMDRRDLLKWIGRVMQQYARDEQIVLYGAGMGGAAVMMAAGESDLPENVKAIVQEGAYSDLETELAHQLKAERGVLASPLMQAVKMVTRHRAGYYPREASAVAQIAKSDLPILMIHGQEDSYVPYSMLDVLYEAANGPKERYAVPGAGHDEAYRMNEELYIEILSTFLAKHITQ